MGCITFILDLALIASIMLFLIREGMKGTIPGGWLGALLAGFMFFVALARVSKKETGTPRSLVGTLLRISLPFFGLVIFSNWYGRGDFQLAAPLFASLMQLLIILFGLYIMFRGFLEAGGGGGSS